MEVGNLMVRDRCFWYESWQAKDTIVSQCYLAETGECPCDYNCEWFIDSLGARALVFEKLLKDKEERDRRNNM